MIEASLTLRQRLIAAAIAAAFATGGTLALAAPTFAAGNPDDSTTPPESQAPETDAPADTETTDPTPADTETSAPAATETETPETTTPAATTPEAEAPALSAPAERMGAYQSAVDGFTLTGSGFEPGVPVTLMVGDTVISDALVPDAAGVVTYSYGGNAFGEAWELGVTTWTMTQGGATATTSVEFYDDSDEYTYPLSGGTFQDTFAPSDTVDYYLLGFTPGATVTIAIEGPESGSFEVTIGDDGTFTGQIVFAEYDVDTGAELGRLDFPVGTYVVTATDPATGDVVNFEFTVVGESGGEPAGGAQTGDSGQSNNGNSLAPTGSDDLFGVAGLGLLLADAGVTAISLGRRRATQRG
ncbi:MAG: hypothetical protein ACTH31_01480 [Pseudoclavibacter sp.]